MNLFEELFYKPWVSTAYYPMPVEHWAFFNEALAAFPVVDSPLPGYTQSSRRTKKVQLIVLHSTGSLEIAKALRWFSNPNTYSSTHFIIDLDGHIQQLVPLENASLHVTNGVFKHSRLVNEMSVGIHLVGNNVNFFSTHQYEGLAMLCVVLAQKCGLQYEDIKCHANIECTPSASDPTPFEQQKFKDLFFHFLTV